jgi:hypothetical protein
VGFQILYKGKHLETIQLAGVHQVDVSHPTRHHCNPMNVECMQNFTSMSALPYCKQSDMKAPIKMPCEYWDAAQLRQFTAEGVMVPTHIASYVQTPACKPAAVNNWTCIGWLYDFVDKTGQVQLKRGEAIPASDIFVADIERYTLLIDHSVRSKYGNRVYSSEMAGFWLDCSEDQSDDSCHAVPMTCKHKNCKQADAAVGHRLGNSHRGDRRSLSLASVEAENKQLLEAIPGPSGQLTAEHVDEELHDEAVALQVQQYVQRDVAKTKISQVSGSRLYTLDNNHWKGESFEGWLPEDDGGVSVNLQEEAVSLEQGDLFSIGLLLKAANVSLDAKRHHVPAWVGGTYRSSGFVLVLRIHYSNIESWLGTKVLPWKMMGPTLHYTFRISKHASYDDFLLRKVHKGGKHDPKHSRILKEFHGIRILIEQTGSVAVWDNIQLLLILTTTLALMAVSACITDCVALNCMHRSEEYAAIKHEPPRRTAKQGDETPTQHSDEDPNER